MTINTQEQGCPKCNQLQLRSNASESNMSKDIIYVHERTSCQCEGPVRCTCPPYDELVFLVNGKGGFGGGNLGMNPVTGEEFFVCRFMGRDFQARNSNDAKEKLRAQFIGFQHIQVI